MRHAIQVNAGLDIDFQVGLQVATNITFEPGKTVIGRAGSVTLLDNQLSALVKSLERTGNRECQEQPYQGEYGALDGGQPCHVGGIFGCCSYRRPKYGP